MMASNGHQSNWRGSRALVTGGAGFIGGHVARALLERGAEVVVFDDLSTGRREGVPLEAEFIEGCVTDADALASAARGCDVVFHLAAMVSIPACEEDQSRCHDVNVVGTGHAIDASLAAGACLVLAGSCAVYGPAAPVPCPEDVDPAPVSAYGSSKAEAEAMVISACEGRGLRGAALRIFNVFGPGQPADSAYSAVVPVFARALAEGFPPIVLGDGMQTRDFVPVDLVAEAFLRAARHEGGLLVNVGTGIETSLLDLLASMQRIAETSLAPAHGPERTGDVRRSACDITRLQSTLRLPGEQVFNRVETCLADVLGQAGQVTGS